MITVAIALGSNIGDRAAHLDWACQRLGRILSNIRISSFRDTAPSGVPLPQADFLNGVVVGETSLSARDLLVQLLAIESERGRERPFALSPRTLDMDLILFGDQTIDEPGLIVPHPRFRERLFVLEPLVEVAPELRDPVTGRNVAELFREGGRGRPGGSAWS